MGRAEAGVTATAAGFAERATAYARDVATGRILACKWVRLACERHLRDLDRQGTEEFPFVFDAERAARACKFVELLPHTKGKWAAGKPGVPGVNLIRLEAWQVWFIASVFGWVHRETGLRRFRTVYLCVPRKNGKSAIAAGVGLYMFCADGEYGSEVYSGATTEKQAWEVFRPAKQMAERTPGLQAAFRVSCGAKNLHVPDNGSRFEPVVGKPGDGASPSCAIVDEYHEHQTDVLFDTMLTGMGAREQPLMLVITTAGDNIAGPCFALQDEVQKVLEGALQDEGLFGVVYTIDSERHGRVFHSHAEGLRRLAEACDCTAAAPAAAFEASAEGVRLAVRELAQVTHDEKCETRQRQATVTADGLLSMEMPPDDWTGGEALIKANPNHGVSVGAEFLEARQTEAVRSSRKQNVFRTKHLNVWVGAREVWMNLEAWKKCGDSRLRIEDFAGEPCWIGLDLASKIDITAVVRVFRRAIGEGMVREDGTVTAPPVHYYVFPRFYLPEERTDDPKCKHYSGWVHDGVLTATDGNIIDYDAIREDLVGDAALCQVAEVAYDPWGATQLALQLQEDHGMHIVEVPQTVAHLSEPMKWVEALVHAGRLHHAGDPILTWMMSNVTAKTDAKENIFPRKEAPENKIDGVVALIMALGRAMLGAGGEKSVYEERGVILL